MASVDTTAAHSTNGRGDGAEIPVENPATGEVIAHVPDCSAEKVAELARLGRAAQPGWQALGFDGRGRVMRRMRKWLMDNGDEVARDARLRDRQDLRGREPHRAALRRRRVELLGQVRRAPTSPTSGCASARSRSRARSSCSATSRSASSASSARGTTRSSTRSATAIPALMAGQQRDPQAVGVHAADLAAPGRRARECGMPDGVFQVATGRGATGAALVDEADMIMFTGSTATGKKVIARGRADADARRARARRQGPDDRPRPTPTSSARRTPPSTTRCSTAARPASPSSACTSRSPSTTTSSPRSSRRCGAIRQGAADRARHARGRRDDVPAAARHRRAPRRRRGRQGRARARRRPPRRGRGPLLRADRARRRRPHDAGDDRGDVRPDAADHERRRRRGGAPPRQRLAVRPRGRRSTAGRARGEQLARRIEAGAVCVNDALLNYLGARAADGRLEGVGLGSRHGAGGIRKYTKQQSLFISRVHLKRELFMFPYKAQVHEGAHQGRAQFLYGRGKRG